MIAGGKIPDEYLKMVFPGFPSDAKPQGEGPEICKSLKVVTTNRTFLVFR